MVKKVTAFDGSTTSSACLRSKLNVEMIDALLCLASNIHRWLRITAVKCFS